MEIALGCPLHNTTSIAILKSVAKFVQFLSIVTFGQPWWLHKLLTKLAQFTKVNTIGYLLTEQV